MVLGTLDRPREKPESAASAVLRPPVETVIHRRVRTILIWQITPRTTNPQHVENAVNHPSVVNSLNATRLIGKDAFDERPLKVAHIRSGHPSAPHCKNNVSESQTIGQEKKLIGTLPN